jgi:predicted deacetylase
MNLEGTHSPPAPERPALLVSVHDVSPLTLEQSRQAVDLAVAAGVPISALTVLVIPRHEDRIALDQHAGTSHWLAELAGKGAHLMMHGYTHRMVGRCYSPRGLAWAHGFARGQGEFYRCSAEETQTRLDRGRTILEAAGLAEATRSFVPPAWLLSAPAREVVRRGGFDFYEEMGGIVANQGLRARRLLGWGSLSTLEATATSWWAAIQRSRQAKDTRFAIHPADMVNPISLASIRTSLAGLLPRTRPLNYSSFLHCG